MDYHDTRFEEARQSNRFLRPLLGIPALYKVLIVNSLIIFIGATGGTWLAANLNNSPYATPASLVIFIALGWLVSVALNFVLLKITFRPLMHLGRVMNRVQEGERSLRAPITRTFNMMLEGLDEASRQRASQIIKAQEQERKRIARELHDETSQVLTSLLISLAVLEEAITTPDGRARIADTRTLAHQTLRAIRNLSIDLRPSALDDLGLLPALRWYIKEYQQKCSIEVEFHSAGFKGRLPAEIETALYRIVQESLTNTAKHANAHKVYIYLKEDADTVDATIIDDGSGFDLQALHKTAPQERGIGLERGLGLVGMEERAVLLNGSLTINSSRGHGTTVEVRIPLHSPDLSEKQAAPELAV